MRNHPVVPLTPPSALHPASLLLAWFALAFGLQWLTLTTLLGVAGLIFPATLFFSRSRFLLLLRRARWLLLSIALLFCFATPGLSLPAPFGAFGLTWEGLDMAATHALRLTLLLALLALLQQYLAIPALVSGLYQLLAPFGEHPLRGRFAVRLLLVLEYIEQGGSQLNWRNGFLPIDPDDIAGSDPLAAYPTLQLQIAPLKRADHLLILLAISGLTALGLLHVTP